MLATANKTENYLKPNDEFSAHYMCQDRHLIIMVCGQIDF